MSFSACCKPFLGTATDDVSRYSLSLKKDNSPETPQGTAYKILTLEEMAGLGREVWHEDLAENYCNQCLCTSSL